MFKELAETLELINELRKELKDDDEVFNHIWNYKLDRNDPNLHRYCVAQSCFRKQEILIWLFVGGNLSSYVPMII